MSATLATPKEASRGKDLVHRISEENGTLRFTLKGVDHSVANALRRTILSDIPTVAFRVFPHDANEATFEVNTSRLNNEILKQRLGCIPVHIGDHSLPYRGLVVEIDVTNDTESVLYVTTEHFAVKDTSTDKYLDKQATRKMFPPDPLTGDYIIFARLRPKLSNEVPGEALKVRAKLSMQTAGVSNMYNVCSTCSYGMTPDNPAQEAAWNKARSHLQEDDDVELMQQDWYNHEARRIFVADSFDFRIETLGVFANRDLVRKACAIIAAKLEKTMNAAREGTLSITATLSTMPNAFDLTLEGEGYTLGKLLEAILHKEAYKKQKALSYVGFRKSHPHDTNSTIRVALSNKSEGGEGTVRTLVAAACGTGLRIMHGIEQAF